MSVEPTATPGRLSTPATGSVAHEERRLITVLFADLSGFTGLSSRLDPEQVQEMANLCFEHLNRAILDQGGTIHKYEGDLVIALFGYPVAHEDDPERAVRAAFQMFGLVPTINTALSSHLRQPTDLGLHGGINSGTVVVGEVGAGGKTEVTVIGDTVNLGSRLKDLAKRGEVMVSGPVFRATRYLFEYEACEPVAVKGIEKPVKAFKPLRVKEKPDPKRGIEGLSSPLVGRESELERLQARVEALLLGSGGATFVLGDAGLGKSRLLEELKAGLAHLCKPVIILEGRCLAYSEGVPYWPFLQVLSTIFRITDQDSREAVRAKLLTRTQAILPEAWPDAVPYLGYLFGVRFEGELDEKINYLEAEGLKTQISVSVRSLLVALFHAQPLLLVIDDFQWMDSASLKLIGFLFESSDPFPMLLLALSRMEKDKEGYKSKEQFKAKLGPDYLEIILEPLSPDASTQLVHHLLKTPGLSAEFREGILAKAEGNPFYLEEIIRSLIDASALTNQSGTWVPASDLRSIALPDTVQAVIAARMDKLDKDVHEVLQMAAVIGRNFQALVLEQLCGLPSLMLTLYLADLEEHEYIREFKRDPSLEYIFHHPLLQEVAYNGLLKKQRRELHRRAGEVIEQLNQDRLEDLTELLAYQYSQGDDPWKALLWLRNAGLKAKDRYANEEAIGYFQQALAILQDGLAGGEEELTRTYESLGEIYFRKGALEKARSYYHDAERTASQDPRVRSRIRRQIASIAQNQGHYQEALKLYDGVEQSLTGGSAEEHVELADCLFSRCWIYCVLGDFRKAIRVGEEGMALLGRIESADHPFLDLGKWRRAKVRGYMTLGTAYSKNHENDRAIELLQKHLDLSRKMDDKQGIGKVCNQLGNEYHIKGDFKRALEMYQEYLTISRMIGYKKGIAIASNNIGYLYQSLGELSRARQLYQTYLALSEEMGYSRGIAMGCLNLGGLFLEAGEFEKAEGVLRRAEKLCQEIGDRPNLIETCLRLAELSKAQADRSGVSDRAAWEYADRAHTLAEITRSKEHLGRSSLTYGKLHLARRNYPEARNHFRNALTMFVEIKEKKLQADADREYARMLKKAAAEGVPLPERAVDYLAKARSLYGELNLPHKVKECF